MRIVTLVLALAAVCTASPVLAQARILTVQNDAPPPPIQHQDATAPAPTAPPPQAPQAPPPVPPQAQQKPPPPAARAQAQKEPPPLPPKTQARARTQPPPPPPPPANRFSFKRVNAGFLRFDHATGQVAYCSAHAVGWACQAVPEDRAALEKEIARLQDEIAALKKQIATLRAPPPPPRPPAPVPPPAAAPDKSGGIKLPNQQDIARARAYLADTWRRLVDMINHFQQNMLGRHDGANGLSQT